MTQTIAVDPKTIKQILHRLDDLAKDVAVIKEKVTEDEPLYGSDEWWEWSDKKAHEDIRKGRFTVIRDARSLKKHLDSLKKS